MGTAIHVFLPIFLLQTRSVLFAKSNTARCVNPKVSALLVKIAMNRKKVSAYWFRQFNHRPIPGGFGLSWPWPLQVLHLRFSDCLLCISRVFEVAAW